MDELIIDGKTYVSSKRAAKLSGYAKDYVGQMCREGRIEARLVGRSWYVLLDALEAHRLKDSKADASTAAPSPTFDDSAWESPKYSPDEQTTLPKLTDRTSVNRLVAPSARELHAEDEAHAALVTQMQSAWQEWFTQKEVRHESDGVVEPREAEMLEEEPVVEEEVAIELSREEEPEEEAAEPVPADDLGADEIPLIRITETKVTRREDLPEPQKVPVRSPFMRYVLQGTFVILAILAAGVALIGTEVIEGDSIPGNEFLAGVRAFTAK